MRSTSVGSRVLGPMTRTSGTPRVVRAAIWERATRECCTSPTMATDRCSNAPLWWRMVYMSRRPWVGWAWRPSPAFTTWMWSRPVAWRCWAMRKGAPLASWRTTNMSACMAQRLSTVSSRVSPFLVDEVDTLRLITSADRRLAAISKVVRVRVEFSKNRLKTLFPRSRGSFFTSLSATSVKGAAVSRMARMISRGSPSRVSRWVSSPWRLSWGLRCSGIDKPQGEGAVGGPFELQILGGRQGLLQDMGAEARGDGQFPPSPVHQDGEVHPRRAAVVEQFVQGRAGGAAGVQDVVDDDDGRAFHVEGDLRPSGLRV